MAEFQEITIDLPDRYRAYARLWSADPARGAVLFLHGIQSHAGWYERSARRLLAEGYTVLQPDRRGSGRNQPERGHAESADQLIDDAFACLDVLCERTGVVQAHLLGVSWGGKLITAMHARNPQRTTSLTLITPGLFPVVGVSKSEMFRIGLSMLSDPNRLYDIPLNDTALFTSLPEMQQYLADDPLQLHQATAGFFLASRRMDRTCLKLESAPPVPIHLMLAADERIIDNEKTRAFVRQLKWHPSVITTYEHSRHTLELDQDADTYLDDLAAWIRDPAAFASR